MQPPCCYFILYKQLPMFCIFLTSFTIHHCMALLQVALVSTPPHKSVRPPCRYYRSEETVKYYFRVVPNCTTSIPNFIQIRPAILEFNHVDRQTDMTSPFCVHFMYNKQCWLVGWSSFAVDFGSYVIIFMNVRVVIAVAMVITCC
jgi:hypothetical protein